MPHEAKDAVDHSVLKVNGPVHRRDLASQLVPDAKMLRAPSHSFSECYQPRCDPGRGSGRLPAMYVSSEMHLNTARQIEAALNRRADARDLFEPNHFPAQLSFTISTSCRAVLRTGRMRGSADTRIRDVTLFAARLSRRSLRA